MQIEFAKCIDVESTVDVSIDDVTSMLYERMRHLEQRFSEPNELDTGRKREILGYVNTVWQCFQAITPEMIGHVEEKNRHLIVDAFQKELEKWKVSIQST
jgi:hypothetical protein